MHLMKELMELRLIQCNKLMQPVSEEVSVMKITTIARSLLILILLFPCDGFAQDSQEIVRRPVRPCPPYIYLEKESIDAYFDVTNVAEYEKLLPGLFSSPEKPMCRVAVIDHYKMEAGSPYQEAMIQILAKYRKLGSGEEILVWYCPEMPVSTEGALCARVWGFPKVLRRITFEGYKDKYVGTGYARDGKTVDLRLVLALKKGNLTRDEKKVLDIISSVSHVTIKDGKVLNWGKTSPGQTVLYELGRVAPHIWQIEFGKGSIEYPNDPDNYLYRLGMGKFITGYWLKQKIRHALKARQE